MLKAAHFDPVRIRAAIDVDDVPRLHGLESAIGPALDALRTQAYHDVHCWVFTPRSFASVLGRAARHGLHGFACRWLDDTVAGTNEFLAALCRCSDGEETRKSWEAARARVGLTIRVTCRRPRRTPIRTGDC